MQTDFDLFIFKYDTACYSNINSYQSEQVFPDSWYAIMQKFQLRISYLTRIPEQQDLYYLDKACVHMRIEN